MPHFIDSTCIGCTACAKLCPTQCIAGGTKLMHVIDSPLCIDCGICGNVCPVSCITNERGETVPKVKIKDRPKAVVDEPACTGCEFCVDHCPYEAIALIPAPGFEQREDEYGGFGNVQPQQVAIVDDKKCTGCRMCEEVCIKNAIMVDLKMDRFKLVLGRYGDSAPVALAEAEALAGEALRERETAGAAAS